MKGEYYLSTKVSKRMEKALKRLEMFKDFDNNFGVQLLGGIDESGRGCVAFDIFSAVCVLPQDIDIYRLNDSKKIKEETRYELAEEIKEKALGWGIGRVSNEEIDEIGIQKGNFLAFKRAISHMKDNSGIEAEIYIIDGNYRNIPIKNYKSIVKGDSKSACIAAASILAKASRDKAIIENAHKEFPQYGFDSHKGYETRAHSEAILKYGLCKYHRRSFCKKYLK